MKISVVIPTYNGEAFIEKCILSVLEQERIPDEIIISDDNSTDKTLDICYKYENKIKIYQNAEGPSGFVNGWNKAIERATGEYISILHQDDKLNPSFIKEAEYILKNNPLIKHFFVPSIYIDKDDAIIKVEGFYDNDVHYYSGKEYVKAYQTVGDPHIHRCPGVITHRDIFKKCQYRSDAGHVADDDFFYRVGQYTDVIGLLKPLAYYRLHEKSETGQLEDVLLVKRLVKDMSFQIKHAKENILFDKESLSFFKRWKYKHIKRLLGYSLKKRNISIAIYALKNLL